jgi:hypothetical protein
MMRSTFPIMKFRKNQSVERSTDGEPSGRAPRGKVTGLATTPYRGLSLSR